MKKILIGWADDGFSARIHLFDTDEKTYNEFRKLVDRLTKKKRGKKEVKHNGPSL